MSANKAKGTSFETDVVNFLKPEFPHAERRASAGKNDKGDIAGIYNAKGSWALECKNVQRITLSEFVDEAKAEATNAGADYYAAIVKRRRKGVAHAFVVMELEQFRSLVSVSERETGAGR